MTTPPTSYPALVAFLIDLLSLAIPFIFALTLLVIVWKIIDAWILHPGDSSKLNAGKQTALIGVIVLVIMSGIWGILELLQSSLFGL